MKKMVLLGAATVAFLGSPVLAGAQEESLPGYEFCGYRDFEDGGWTYDPPGGAGYNAYASGMSCRAARRNVTRLKYGGPPLYAPKRTGYRCVRLKNGYEFSDTRCIKRGGGARFRTQSGS